MKVYKYLQEQYVDSFINKGQILFRSLSYFKDYEDCIRGDKFEGTKKFKPINGLEITKATGERLILPYSFESTVKTDDIFVFCTSMVLSEELAQEFESNVCIEINVDDFSLKLKADLFSMQKVTHKKILSQNVEYYPETKPPIVDWALPEKIIMSKLDCFKRQKEYRFAFCFGDAFSIGSTTHRLVKTSNDKQFVASNYSHQILQLGSISDICKVHRIT
jgi:hypothetical protein